MAKIAFETARRLPSNEADNFTKVISLYRTQKNSWSPSRFLPFPANTRCLQQPLVRAFLRGFMLRFYFGFRQSSLSALHSEQGEELLD